MEDGDPVVVIEGLHHPNIGDKTIRILLQRPRDVGLFLHLTFPPHQILQQPILVQTSEMKKEEVEERKKWMKT